jgi:ABC-2 type transport system permease protein
MLALAGGVFGLHILSAGAAALPFLLVLFLFGIALGITGSSIVLRLGPAAEWFIWPIPAIVSPFAGVFYPIAVLPRWMQWLARLLPPSYVFEGLRSVVRGGSAHPVELAVGAAIAVLYILLACRLFTGVYRHALRTGLIARYSAESLS